MSSRSLCPRSPIPALVLAAVLFSAPLQAQVTVGWQTAPLTGPYGTKQTTDMDVTVGGTSYVSGYVPTQSSDPAPGLTLMRIEPDGSAPWSILFPIGLTEPSFVAVSPVDGGVLQVASYYNFPVHQYRTWAVKYDGNGAVSWSKDVPGLNTTTEIRKPTKYIGVDALGNSYIGGTSPSGSSSVPRIVSFDSAGNVRFSTPLVLTLGAPTTGATVDVLTLDPASGDVFVAGHSGFNPAAGTTSYVARLTSSGAVTWLTETPAPAGLYVWVRDIGVDAQARVSTLAQHSTSDSYTGSVSWSLARLDAQGLAAGAIPFTTAGTIPQAIDVGDDGAVALSGYQSGPGYPGVVARYDSSLNFVWERTVPIAGATSVNLDLVTLQANGDVTASGTRYMPQFSSSEFGALCVRCDAAGDLRWQYEFGSQDANEFVPAHDVDELGRTRLAIRQYPVGPGSPYASRQITLELDPESHSFCHGDGTSGACPCGNTSGVLDQSGCLNSTGGAAKLVDSGSASLANDTLAFACSGVGATTIGLLVEGSSTIQPFAFGDGLFCFGGSILRLFIVVANGGVLSMPAAGDPSIHLRAASLGGPIAAGERRVYQTYYRDAALAFCPSGGSFNFSNALLVHWTP